MQLPRALAFLLLLLPANALAAEDAPQLTFARVFGEPSLEGPRLGMARFSPDGRYLAWLRGSAESAQALNLWLLDTETGDNRLLVAASSLGARGEDAAERARRERERIRESGITRFQWTPAGDALLIPKGGVVHHVERETGRLTAIDPEGGARMDARISPDGRCLAFVRDNDLYVRDLASGREKRLTRSRDPFIRYGLADFIAAEEMGRGEGYWWSPDGTAIAFTETDARHIPHRLRHEILAGDSRLNPEPYPFAGGPNVKTRLGVVEPDDGRIRWLDLGDDSERYLAQVTWAADGRSLLVVQQSRDQKTVTLRRLDRRSGKGETLVTEKSDRWINLHDDLMPLDDGRFIWSSEREGVKRLYLHAADGEPLGALTPAGMPVDALIAVDPDRGRVHFEAPGASPLERHLFVVDLDPATDDAPRRVTQVPGIHATAVNDKAGLILDRYATPDIPAALQLVSLDGDVKHVLLDGAIGPDHPYAPFLAGHVRPEFGALRAADGTELHYRLFLPPGPGPHKLLVHVYGGPGVQYVTRGWAPLWYQAALDRGYGIFSLDGRGSKRRGAAFEAAFAKGFGHTEVADQMAGIAFLKSHPKVDPDRIAVYGWSYGGYMALKLAAAGGGIRAAVSGAPVTDWRLYDTHYTERYMGLPQDRAEAYDRSAVFADLDRMDAPLLLIHGMADDNVLFVHMTRLIAALQEKGRMFDLMTYPGETHAIRDPAIQTHLYETIFRFLDRELQ